MMEPIPEEFLSAYLDDELSAEDRARVDAQLAVDEELKKSFNELCQLRDEIRSLPRYSLSEEFAKRIAEQIEIESSPSVSVSQNHATDRKRFAFGIMAAAALIMISLWGLSDWPKNQQQVTMQTNEITDNVTEELKSFEFPDKSNPNADSEDAIQERVVRDAPIQETQPPVESIAMDDATSQFQLSSEPEQRFDSEQHSNLTLDASPRETPSAPQALTKMRSVPPSTRGVSAYDLVVQYAVNEVQLDLVSTKWKEWELKSANGGESDTVSYLLTGTPEEVVKLLKDINTDSIQIAGKAATKTSLDRLVYFYESNVPSQEASRSLLRRSSKAALGGASYGNVPETESATVPPRAVLSQSKETAEPPASRAQPAMTEEKLRESLVQAKDEKLAIVESRNDLGIDDETESVGGRGFAGKAIAPADESRYAKQENKKKKLRVLVRVKKAE